MTEQELQCLVEEISREDFGKPFIHEALFNKRLRTTGGRYKLSDHSIEVNPLVLQLHGADELIGIIKHELCHYHLHIEGKGYKHGDSDFKHLLKQTNSPRFCKELAVPQQRRTHIYTYICTSCSMKYARKRRMDPAKYRCGKCSGKIIEQVKTIQS